MELCVVLITVPNAETGQKLARLLVEEKLAACVNRMPGLTSVYAWQGRIEQESEELLIVKTRFELVDTITERVKQEHPYQVPEIIALPIGQGNPDYLDWVGRETRPAT